MTSPTTPAQALASIAEMETYARENPFDRCSTALLRALAGSREGWTEVERLREALKPFAEIAAPLHPVEDPSGPSSLDLMTLDGSDELQLCSYVGPSRHLNILDAADFRRALASYRSPQGEAHQLLTDLPGDES